ncbi:fusaric acid resistance protein [Dyella japonica A8]|uniref:Fusaric acid resistance protein n=2 Tax=Dyella japonica TaxID=231455 RepID=A0A075K3D5_9GAMM|nr:fusaric acid resistance protein [Dyella japonica A8]
MRRRSRMSLFLTGERQAWIFVFKCLLAFYLTAWLSMLLQLQQPATAMITVAIVMHPQRGMVLAKSFYRAIGTVTGSLFALLLMALFPQQSELLVLSLSLWVGLCSGGAVFHRNFRAYGFVLAGYTAAVVVLPAASDPHRIFDTAMLRVSEVMLGIVVAALVSDMVWPEGLRDVLQRTEREHYEDFMALARESLLGSIPRAQLEQAHLRCVRAAVQLEDLRASVVFEDPQARARSSRMRLLNLRYMAAATSFQSLHHLINRLERGHHGRTAQALIQLYAPVGEALAPAGSLAPRPLAARLDACEERLQVRAAQLRATLRQEPDLLLEFDSGATLLRRFAGELCDFVALEATLRDTQGHLPGASERVVFRRSNDRVAALIAAARTFFTMLGLGAFWLMTAWPSGTTAMLLATLFSGLLATTSAPVAATANTLAGFALGALASYVSAFVLLPGGDGFVMLVLGTLPLLMIGPYLTTRNATLPGVGTGYTLGFVLMLALKNPMTYESERFINEALASLFGLMVTGMAFMVIPAVVGTRWLWRRQMQQLRRQVQRAATAPMPGLLYAFESGHRDLFHQIVQHTRHGSASSRSLMAWGLAIHECGRALLELRQDMESAALPPDVRALAQQAVQALAQLYDEPDKARWTQADRAVECAIVRVCHSLPRARASCQPVLSHLLQLRNALRDDESALAPYIVGHADNRRA